MNKKDLLKTLFTYSSLSFNLLNYSAMEINNYSTEKYIINNSDFVNKMIYKIDEYKNVEYSYYKENDIVSTLKIIHMTDCIKIVDLETNVKFRRKGFATKLLLHMFNQEAIYNCGEKVLPEIILDSTLEGFSLYKKLGFIENEEKDVMNLQPMKLIWNSNIRKQHLTINNSDEIVLNNNNLNNNNDDYDDFK